MFLKKFVYLVLTVATAIVIMFTGSGCANIISPTGGPRDSLPPHLEQATPRDSTLRFNANRIVFSFDEYVNVQNVQQNLIVSPLPKINPVVDFKLRTVTVRIKDTLEANTTYSFNFGNAIVDVNEGNIAKQFTYVFSTGTHIDSGRLTGRVLLAETGKIDSTLTVLLHRSASDSAVVKDKPRYIARLDKDGRFTFRNLPRGTFYLYALKDESATYRYLAKSQLFAFAGKPIIIDDTTAPVNLYAYVEKLEEPKRPVIVPVLTREKKPEDKRLRVSTNLENGQQDLLNDFELLFASSLKTFDSSKIFFSDEKFQPIPNHRFVLDSLRQKVTLRYAWQPEVTYKLVLNKDFATDSLGRALTKADTVSIKTKKLSDYGSVRLRFPALDLARNPILLLLQSDKIVFTHVFTAKDFFTKLFKPGEYDIRILYDENRNGKWDAGDFFGKHRQPEKVQSVTKKLAVRGNWDNDVTVGL